MDAAKERDGGLEAELDKPSEPKRMWSNRVRDFASRHLEQLFWGAVLLGWVPVLAGHAVFPSLSGETSGPMLMPEPMYWQHPAINLLSVLFVILIPLTFTLRKRFSRQAEATLFFSRPGYRELSADFKRAIRPRPPNYLLAALPLLGAMTIPLFANGAELNQASAILYTAYLASFFVSVYLYLRHAHLLASAFVVYCLILVVDSILLYAFNTLQQHIGWSVFDNHLSILGSLFDLYSPNLLKLALFMLCVALLRMAWMGWQDNLTFLEETKNADIVSHAKATARLWYPMLLIFALFTGFYSLANSLWLEPLLVRNIVGCSADPVDVAEGTQPDQGPWSPVCPDDLTDDDGKMISLAAAIELANTRKLGELNEAKEQALGDFTVAFNESVNDVPGAVVSQVNGLLPTRLPGTETRWCGLNPVCWAENGVKSATNNAYVSAKQRQLRRLRQELGAIARDTTTSASEKEKLMNEAFSRQIEQLEDVSNSAVASSFEGISLLGWLLFLYSLLILAKTYLIVFSRVSFARKTTYSATFKTINDSDAAGEIVRLGHDFKLPVDDKRTYFFARNKVTVIGPPMDRVTPQRFKAFFARLFSGSLSLNRVVPSNTDDGAGVSINPPAELVMWKLRRNERVFFHFNDFVGMSDTVKLERRVSLSISTLIFGQMIHYCAVGPGRLYLRTIGQPAVIEPGATTPGHNASKLVAWNIASRFDVDANLNVTNTFLSESNVRPTSEANDMVVFDLSVTRGQSRSAGILQFAKSFLLPV